MPYPAIQKSWEAGNDDPCNSEFKTDSLDKLCATIVENDVSSILDTMDYPIVICHSPDDEIIYIENVPNTTANDNLIMIEDVPGAGVTPSGSHGEAGVQCALAFLMPYFDGTSDVSSVLPIDDLEGTCDGMVTTTSSTASSVIGSPTSSPTAKPTSSAFALPASLGVIAGLVGVFVSTVV